MVGLTYPQTEYTQIHLYKQYFESGLETNFNYCKEFILFILFFYAKMVDKTNSEQSSNSKHDFAVGKKTEIRLSTINRQNGLLIYDVRKTETISSKE